MSRTVFTKLNDGWNAEPNAPAPSVDVEGSDVLLLFDLNPFQFPQFHEGQRACLRFAGAWRYRLGTTNDEGWYRGQCRFSGVAPAWGEFYEVTGDQLLSRCPEDWVYVSEQPGTRMRHFLFYLRDETFECDARDYTLDLGWLAAHLREMEGRLARVLDRVVGLPPERIAFDRDLLKHGEPGLALESLCDQLDEADIAIPADVLVELDALAASMGMTLRVRPRVHP